MLRAVQSSEVSLVLYMDCCKNADEFAGKRDWTSGKRYHLSEFRPPAIPSKDRAEMPHSNFEWFETYTKDLLIVDRCRTRFSRWWNSAILV